MKSGGYCEECGEPLGPEFHADHRLPFSRGGSTTLFNGAALCAPCNLEKGNRMLKLRAWQQQALVRAISLYTSNTDRHFIINAAPGAGKTLAAVAIASELLGRDMIDRVVVIAPRQDSCRAMGSVIRKSD